MARGRFSHLSPCLGTAALMALNCGAGRGIRLEADAGWAAEAAGGAQIQHLGGGAGRDTRVKRQQQ